MTTKNQREVFLGGVLIGSAIGTLTGLLIAPRSGKDSLKIIQKTADALPEIRDKACLVSTDLSNNAIFHSQRLVNLTQNNFNYNIKRLKVAIATGIKASKESMKNG